MAHIHFESALSFLDTVFPILFRVHILSTHYAYKYSFARAFVARMIHIKISTDGAQPRNPRIIHVSVNNNTSLDQIL